MRDRKDILILTITLVILFMFFIGLTNTLINSYVNDPSTFQERREDIAASPREPVKAFLQKPEDNVLIPADPAQYSIEVITDKELSLSQDQWDANIKTVLLHLKTSLPMEGKGKTPKELKERLNRINRQIKDLERINRKGSGGQTDEIKLQSLYILKSSLIALEETTGEKILKKK